MNETIKEQISRSRMTHNWAQTQHPELKGQLGKEVLERNFSENRIAKNQ